MPPLASSPAPTSPSTCISLPKVDYPHCGIASRTFSRMWHVTGNLMSSSLLHATMPIRTIESLGEVLPTVFRDQLILSYEIPKWDGDLGRPSLYFPLTSDVAHRKVELLHKCFPSQAAHDWWDDEVFLGLARLRGMECRAPYSEAFTCTKSVVRPLVPSPRQTAEQVASANGFTAGGVGQ